MLDCEWREILDGMRRKFDFGVADAFHRIKENWTLVIKDEVLEEFCHPESLEGNVLYVKIDNSMARTVFCNSKSNILLNLGIICPDANIEDVRMK